MATAPRDIPHGRRRIYRRFARWRRAHPGVRLPIPGRLWKAAAEAAREHGICRTAQVLRLEYGKLRRMVEWGNAEAMAPTTRAHRSQSATSSPLFMELVAPPAIGLSECLIELEGAHGGRADGELVSLTR